jgi:hypothetical protein
MFKLEVEAEDPYSGMTLGELRHFVELTKHLDHDVVPEVEYHDAQTGDYYDYETIRVIQSLEVKA